MLHTLLFKRAWDSQSLLSHTGRGALLLLALLLWPLGAWGQAQVTRYGFTQAAGTYTALPIATTPAVTPTVLGASTTSTPIDDNVYSVALPFTFIFDGVLNTSVNVSTNGFITFGSALPGTTEYAPISGTGTYSSAISILGADLFGRTAAGNLGELSYSTLGTSPNRTFVVQWKNFARYSGATGLTDLLNFQIQLSETSNVAALVYGPCTVASTATTQQVGLRGTSSIDYNNRAVASAGSWSSSTAGTANTSVTNLPATTNPSSGLTYTFTPTVTPAAPTTATFTNVTNTGLKINWVDNSTNEYGFVVYRSTDNITFTYIGSTASTTTAATGGAYSFTDTGLAVGTQYYYRVGAYAEGAISAFLTGSQTTAAPLCGTYTVGPSATYATLTAAFAALAASGSSSSCTGVIFELQSNYVSTSETFPLTYSGAANITATNPVTVRPAAGATGRSITSSAAVTFNISGGKYFIIDGRPGGSGATVSGATASTDLTIVNTSASGYTVRISNDATYNTVQHCQLQGASTTGFYSVVYFGSTASTTGNSNNVIQNNTISGVSSSAPVQVAIFSNNNSLNASNSILNNNIADFYTSSTTSTDYAYGIWLYNPGNGWTISGNSFYQTASRAGVSGLGMYGIYIDAGSGHTISGNYIGGSAASAGGTPLTVNGTATTYAFGGIYLTVGTTTATSVQGNTVGNISWLSNSPNPVLGIYASSGNLNIGTTTANYVGANAAGTGTIAISAGVTGLQTFGIYSGSSGTVAISNNVIGGITVTGATASISSSLTGIAVAAGTNTISGNKVGVQSDGTTASALNAATAGTGTTAQTCYGITSSSSTSATITGNVVANLSNAYTTGTGAATSQAVGIFTSAGVNTIGGTAAGAGNTVSTISNAIVSTGTGSAAPVIGIAQTSTTAGQSVIGNTVSGLSNTAAATTVVGILYGGTTTGNNLITRNLVYGFTGSSASANSLYGIQQVSGAATVANNMVRLGLGLTNGSLTIGGIYKSATSAATRYLHNSVYVTGTAGSGSANSFAFGRIGTNADVLVNNALVNVRSGGTGQHVPVQLAATASLVVSNNVYYTTNTLATGGTAAEATVGGTATATITGDAGSFLADPQFSSPTTTVPNLHISATAATPVEATGSATYTTTDDFDGETRSSLTPVDIGADAGNFTPITIDPAVTAFVTPVQGSGCLSNSAQTVTVTVKNNSTAATTSAVSVSGTVSYNGGAATSLGTAATIPAGLAGGASANATLTTSYNMSAAGTYAFTATITGGGDQLPSNNTLTTTITVVIPAINAAATPASVCSGSSSSLTAEAGLSSTSTYGVASATYAVYAPGTATVTTINAASIFTSGNNDDGYYAATIPFTFNYFGNDYTNVNIGTNGYITVGPSATFGATIRTPSSIASISNPLNMIAGDFRDLVLASSGALIGAIKYYTLGATPNRLFIISYEAVPSYNSSTTGAAPTSTFQIALHETTNVIDIVSTAAASAAVSSTANGGSGHVQGIQNSNGSIGFAPPTYGSPSNTWQATNQKYVFTPGGNFTYNWTQVSGNGLPTTNNTADISVTPTQTSVYKVTASLAGSCDATKTVTVKVPTLPTPTVTNVTGCFGGTNGTIAATVTDGTGPYKFEISANGGTSYTTSVTSQASASYTYTGLAAGSYLVRVTDTGTGAGCAITSSTLTVTQPAAVTATLAGNGPFCGSGAAQLTGTLTGVAPFSLTYTTNGANPTVVSSPTTAYTINPGTISATTTYALTSVTDANSCPAASLPASVTITVNPAPTVNAGASPASVCAGNTYTTTGSYGGAATSATYTSSGTGTFTNGGVINGTTPSVTYTPSAADISAGSVMLTLTSGGQAAPCPAATATLTLTINTSTTWTGATSTDWFTSSNWSACVPTRLTDATIPAGLTNYPSLTTTTTAEVRTLTLASGSSLSQSAGTLSIYGNLANNAAATLTLSGGMVGFLGATSTVASPVTFYNLTTNLSSASSTVALSGNNTVSNSVTMTQGLLTTSGTLTLAPAATIAETNASYVTGAVATTRTLTAGTANSFGGLGLVLTPAAGSASPGATSVIRTTGTTLTGVGTSQSVQRYFDINPVINTGLNVQMDFMFFNHENTNNISAASFKLYKSDNGNSGPWQSQAFTTTAMVSGGYTVTKTGITDFSTWTVGDGNSPLPVSLTRFEAVRQDQNASLTWATASETDNAGFEVQVSLDGTAFRKLGFVAPASPSSLAARTYSFLDREAGKAGLRYYRLRQLDLSGKGSFSVVRTVAFGQVSSLSAAPNPFGETLTLHLQVPVAATGTPLTLTDALGRVVLHQVVDVPAGASQLMLPGLAGLPIGMYLLHLPLDGQVRTVKLVKQ